MSYTLRARVNLGYWPQPSQPDPKVLPFDDSHRELVYFFLFLTLGMTLLRPTMLWIGKWMGLRPGMGSIYLFWACWLAIIVLLSVSPINFLEWFLD